MWKGLNPSRSPWLLRVLKFFWQYGFLSQRKKNRLSKVRLWHLDFGISGAARSLSFIASSSHFFLQISTCSMQNWGRGRLGRETEAFSYTLASRPHFTQKFFSRLSLTRVGIRPSGPPRPMPVLTINKPHGRLGRLRRGARRGSGREATGVYPKRGLKAADSAAWATGGGGKSAADPAGRAGGRPAGRTAGLGLEGGGGWREAGRMGEGEEAPRRRLGLRWAAGRGRSRPQPIPTPHPGGLGAKTKLGSRRRAPAWPGRVGSRLRPPPRANARLTRAELGPVAGPVSQREALWKRLEMARAPPPPPITDRDTDPGSTQGFPELLQGLWAAGQSPRAAAWRTAQTTNSREKRRPTPDGSEANRGSRRLSQWGNSAPPAGRLRGGAGTQRGLWRSREW